MEFEPKSKVYIQTDADGLILRCEGGYTAILRSDEELEADRAELPKPDPAKNIEDRLAALEADAEQAALDRAALTLLLTGEETV